jgi:hypothetical protein
MTDRKLKLRIVTNPYGGNGGGASESPDGRKWINHLDHHVFPNEPRLEPFDPDVDVDDYCDTPIPMTRNAAVLAARHADADLLMFVDSDQVPDTRLGKDADAKPFFQEAFDFIYKHWDKGPHVVGAPYLGGDSGNENVFVMRWRNRVSSFYAEVDLRLDQYTREETDVLSGIHECAALPTGCILYDMRCFNLIEPKPDNVAKTIATPILKRIEAGNNTFTREQMQELVTHVVRETRRSERSFFYYEFTDKYEWQKASTEDVTNTRDISLAGLVQLGYNPVHCAWSSWAGHLKSRNVEKPLIITASEVASRFKNAVLRGISHDKKLVNVCVANRPTDGEPAHV